MILKLHGITSTKVLQALERDDMKELNINLGQRFLLWKLVKDLQSPERETQHSEHISKETFWCLFKCFGGIRAKELNVDLSQQALLWKLVMDLQSSEKESRSQGSRSDKQYGDQGQWKYGGDYDSAEQENKRFDQRHRKKNGGDKRNRKHTDNMDEGTFWCLFKCLGGIGAVGLGGILALVTAVLALPIIGFTAIGIKAGSLAAWIMSLYGGNVTAGSLVAILQSAGAAGLSWKAILTALFGSDKVMAAVSGGYYYCSYCYNEK